MAFNIKFKENHHVSVIVRCPHTFSPISRQDGYKDNTMTVKEGQTAERLGFTIYKQPAEHMSLSSSFNKSEKSPSEKKWYNLQVKINKILFQPLTKLLW